MLLILLISLIGALQPVPKEKYENAVEYVGWQVMDAYMKDYTNIRPDRTGEQKGYEVFLQQFPADSFSIENPPVGDEVAKVLKSNDWSNAYKNLYSRIINWKSMYDDDWNGQEASTYLENQIENISLQALGVDDSAYMNLRLAKAQLQDEVALFFSPPMQEENVSQRVEAAPEGLAMASEEQQDLAADRFPFFSQVQNSQEWLDYQVNIISLVLFLLLLALLLYLFNMYKKIDERIDRHRKEINEINSELFVLRKKISGSGAGNEQESKLRGRLEALESKIQQLHVEHTAQEVPASRSMHAQAAEAVATQTRTEEFFLSTPNSDGSFNVSSMSASYKPTASIYKFVVAEEDGGDNMAYFTVAEQYETVKDALSSPGSYLDPVCESLNAFSPAARRIINIKPGRAFRKGDKWIVRPEDKAVIRYE